MSGSGIYECPRCIDVPSGDPGPCADCPLGKGCRECESANAIDGTPFCPTCTELRRQRLAARYPADPCGGMLVSRKRENGGLA